MLLWELLTCVRVLHCVSCTQPPAHLLCCKLEHGCEGRLLGHAEPAAHTPARSAHRDNGQRTAWFASGSRVRTVGEQQIDAVATVDAAHTRNGSFGSDVSVILKVTLELQEGGMQAG